METVFFLTTFWSHPDGNTVRVLYISPTSWGNTLLADIDLVSGKVDLALGSHVEYRHKIAKFTIDISNNGDGYRKLSLVGCDRTLIGEARDILERCGNEYRLLKIHVKAALDYHYHYIDASYLPLVKVRRQINEVYTAENGGQPEGAFHCGVTDDLDIRMERHRTHDCGIVGNKAYAWVCPTVQYAETVRQWAEQNGFRTDNDKAINPEETRNSTIVYLFKRENTFEK